MPKDYSEFLGKVFGRLTIVSFSKDSMVTCKCICGNKSVHRWQNVKKGKTRSCGCLETESRYTHGKSGTTTYITWENMINRCNPDSKQHKNYPQYHGISVCERWKSFDNFLEDMGERPLGKTLDRIDGTKGYEPENCRWATKKQQQQNIKSNRWITFNGRTECLSEWSRITGIPDNTLYYRLKRNWPLDKAFKK